MLVPHKNVADQRQRRAQLAARGGSSGLEQLIGDFRERAHHQDGLQIHSAAHDGNESLERGSILH